MKLHSLSYIDFNGDFVELYFIVVTLDYKSLLLLIQKIHEDGEDESACREQLAIGGKGFDVECCVFCTALRVS